MSDIVVVPSGVIPANANTVIARGTAGATITAGQTVYADAANNNQIKPATQTSPAAAAVVGVALNSASSGQPVEYATSGDVTFTNLLATSKVYVLGSGAGGLSLSADLDSAATNTRYGTVIGVATSGTNLRLSIVTSGVLRP
ncbi:MAG: hypothetical protein ABI947_12865 [Chloroflexota bacterium]